MELISPPLSFVQFTTEFDPLPVVLDTDLKFQQLLVFDTEQELLDRLDHGCTLRLCGPEVDVQDMASITASTLLDWGGLNPAYLPALHRIDRKQLLLYWDAGLPGFTDRINPGQCAVLVLLFPDGGGTQPLAFRSNRLFRETSSKRTSVVEYWCEEDAYGFHYCSLYVPNRVRLPLYLSRPQFQDDEAIYRRSNGTRKLLKSVTSVEFSGYVQLMTQPWHERIKHALSHDFVALQGENYSGGIVKNGGYEIEWPEFMDFPAGPAKFKALATPYQWRNTNCANCLPWGCDVVVAIDDLAAEEGAPTFDRNIYGVDFTETGGTADALILEFSLDGGANWNPITEETSLGSYRRYYSIGENALGGTPHQLRIRPVCENEEEGTVAIANYPF
jgi:hypothetical protein